MPVATMTDTAKEERDRQFRAEALRWLPEVTPVVAPVLPGARAVRGALYGVAPWLRAA